MRESSIRLYLSRQASSLTRYALEQAITGLCGWIPTIVGIAIRAVLYRLILRMDGMAAIENGVRLLCADNIRLGRNAYLDQGVYIHACPAGVTIGDGTLVMHGAILHVYNFRGLPHAGIRIGQQSLLGEYTIICGQGGVSIATESIRRLTVRSSRSTTSSTTRTVRSSRTALPCRAS
jgi:hypothetical protein